VAINCNRTYSKHPKIQIKELKDSLVDSSSLNNGRIDNISPDKKGKLQGNNMALVVSSNFSPQKEVQKNKRLEEIQVETQDTSK
jgi:hypothetical protein